MNILHGLFENALSGEVEVQLAFFDTGIPLRNEHMLNRYLEVKKFPTTKLTSLRAQLSTPEKDIRATEKIPFSAELSLHGVKKPIAGIVEIKQQRAGMSPRMEFMFDIDTKEFGIETPTYLGIRVTDTVRVTANVEGATK